MGALRIRALKAEDKIPFIEAMQRSQMLHDPWVDPPKNEVTFEAYLLRAQQPNQTCFLLCDAQDHMVGVFNISEIVRGMFQSAYLGFYAVAEQEGRGYMSRGLKLVLSTIFEEMNLHRIEANIQPNNSQSIHLVKANGFSKEGLSPKYLNIDGRWQDHERWALLYEDWMQCKP